MVRLIIGSIAGQGEARADITRYICNDNCAEGGREMKNMNIGNLGLLSGAEKMRKLFSYCNCNSQGLRNISSFSKLFHFPLTFYVKKGYCNIAL